jgi:hypothetical protein
MFNQMKAMGAVAGLLKNKEKLKEKADEVKVRLETTRVFGESGGGAVRVTCTCRLVVERIEIAPALASGAEPAELERLVEEGVNDALVKAQDRAKAIIAQAADEMGLGEILGQSDLAGLLG